MGKTWVEKRVPILFAISGVILALMMGALLAYVVVSRSNQTKNCRAALRVRDAMVLLLQDAEQQINHPPPRVPALNPAQKEQALTFYNKEITRLQAIRCDST